MQAKVWKYWLEFIYEYKVSLTVYIRLKIKITQNKLKRNKL